MNTAPPRDDSAPDAAGTDRVRRPAALTAIAVLLFAEAAAVLALAVWQAAIYLAEGPASYPTGFALLVLVLLAAVWGAATGVAALRARRWFRGSAVTWQVLQFAVGVAALRGDFWGPAVGALLLAAAVAGVVLTVLPSVTAAVAEREETAGATGD